LGQQCGARLVPEAAGKRVKEMEIAAFSYRFADFFGGLVSK
jgi:hypothetical protein